MIHNHKIIHILKKCWKCILPKSVSVCTSKMGGLPVNPKSKLTFDLVPILYFPLSGEAKKLLFVYLKTRWNVNHQKTQITRNFSATTNNFKLWIKKPKKNPKLWGVRDAIKRDKKGLQNRGSQWKWIWNCILSQERLTGRRRWRGASRGTSTCSKPNQRASAGGEGWCMSHKGCLRTGGGESWERGAEKRDSWV